MPERQWNEGGLHYSERTQLGYVLLCTGTLLYSKYRYTRSVKKHYVAHSVRAAKRSNV
jgi:hypothetical protein